MKLTPLGIEGAWLAESPVWSDDRGFFREWFKDEDVFVETGIDFSIKQANISQSNRGVIRGIHYSLAPDGQSKWVTCMKGSILDTVVDIRPDSVTFKQHLSIELNELDGKAILIGPGLGHGFSTLIQNSAISYLLTSAYHPEFEYEINPLDPELGIDWKLESDEIVLSTKDREAPTLLACLMSKELPLSDSYTSR